MSGVGGGDIPPSVITGGLTGTGGESIAGVRVSIRTDGITLTGDLFVLNHDSVLMRACLHIRERLMSCGCNNQRYVK